MEETPQQGFEPRNVLGDLIIQARGKESRVQFARRLGLSYTFTRALESGTRFPSDAVLAHIAKELGLELHKLVLAAYCARSQALTDALRHRGLGVEPWKSTIEKAQPDTPDTPGNGRFGSRAWKPESHGRQFRSAPLRVASRS